MSAVASVQADEPAEAPPPFAFVLGAGAVSLALESWARAGGRRSWRRVAALVPWWVAVTVVSTRLGRQRALAESFTRRGDALGEGSPLPILVAVLGLRLLPRRGWRRVAAPIIAAMLAELRWRSGVGDPD